MSSSGLTRRRGGGGGGANNTSGAGTSTPTSTSNTTSNPSDLHGDRSSTPSHEGAGHETSYATGENGHRIVFDPRDISESKERAKQPKLTLMEEVLLLGLKDKQVCFLWLLVSSTSDG